MWTEGQVVIRREVLNDGRAWLEVPVIVVRDDDELLATFIAQGAPFRFPPGPWPTPHGRHPWHGKEPGTVTACSCSSGRARRTRSGSSGAAPGGRSPAGT